MQGMSQPCITKSLWGQGWDTLEVRSVGSQCPGTSLVPAAGRGGFGCQPQSRACPRGGWLPGHAFPGQRRSGNTAPALPLLGPRLIPCCSGAFCLVPNMSWPGFNFLPLLLGLNFPEFKWLFSNPFFLSMNALEGCNENHLSGSASCPFLKICFAPGGEDTPAPPAMSKAWARC